MSQIGAPQFEKTFELGAIVARGQIKEQAAIDALIVDAGMNGHSATGYIYGLQKMLAGELYTRTINREATRYFLEKILSDFGVESSRLAIQSVKLHLSYYPGGSQPGIAAILKKFESKIDSTEEISQISFESSVEEIMHSAMVDLAEKLPPAGTKPKAVQTSVVTFVRNATVAAYVRRRADGSCERCDQPAPFLKKSSGLPYLEVHHLVRLADHGDDTADNAIAGMSQLPSLSPFR